MDWLMYFETNHAERPTIPWGRGIDVEADLRGPLVRSLQRFQIGESGDGVHLKDGAAATGDTRYAETIGLFIAEEQEHARMLARILAALDAPLLAHHWSDALFVRLRRLLGLHHELLVLLIAEMIAKRYYRALFDGTHDPVLRAVFGQILRDEEGHVAFHVEALRAAFAPLPGWGRAFLRAGWAALFTGACVVVAWDHRGVLRATGVSSPIFLRDCFRIFAATASGIFPDAAAVQEPAA
jgi:hypothetical protein